MLDLTREFKREESKLKLQSLLQTILILVFIVNALVTYYILWLRGNIMRAEIEGIDNQLTLLLPIEERINKKTAELNSLIAKRREIENKIETPKMNLDLIRNVSIYAPSDFWLSNLSISSTDIIFDGYGLSIRGVKNFIQSIVDNTQGSSLSRTSIQKVKLGGTECYNFHIEISRGKL
jgi:hypothetical protein